MKERRYRHRGQTPPEWRREPKVSTFVVYEPPGINVLVGNRWGSQADYDREMSRLYFEWSQEQLRLAREEFDVERQYYAKKIDELQSMMKRLLEDK